MNSWKLCRNNAHLDYFTQFSGSLPFWPPHVQLFALCMYFFFLFAVLVSCVLNPMFYSLLHAGSMPILRGGHIFRLSGVCPISMFIFCFMHWSEGSVLFGWCLVSLLLNYFRAGRMWIVWFPSFSPEISGPAAPAPIAFHSFEFFEH